MAPKKHPYHAGNYAPIRTTLSFQPCSYEGSIPHELLGGQYVRNGSNPLQVDTSRNFHWFDGDGMLTGVFFERIAQTGVRPTFVNQYVRTDVHDAVARYPRLHHITPSVTTLISPTSTVFRVMMEVVRAMALIVASLWGLVARPIRRTSTANTNVLHHDGRVLATNETGPPMRVLLPSLRTVGWFTGSRAEGEPTDEKSQPYFGGPGVEGFFKEMTTAHPHVDPRTDEMFLYHATFLAPFVTYSIIPAERSANRTVRLNRPVPGFQSGKIMHDLGVSRKHTVMIDLPVSLDPFNLRHNRPVVKYDLHGQTRFGVFLRYEPEKIEWYTTGPCMIMHTVNTWDEETFNGTQVHLLLCRMNGVAPLYHMGDLEAPKATTPASPECRLYYYQFPPAKEFPKQITHQWALSAIPFEFPHVPHHLQMTQTRFVYGNSMRTGDFAKAFISNFKVDCLVKIDVAALLARGLFDPPAQVDGCVDKRSISEVLVSDDKDDPIKVFALPDEWYAQECSFIPRKDGKSEDDGWLVTYVFDESQLDDGGVAPEDSRSELWIIDAVGMKEVVGRVILPQRVPYGMHGNWFPEEQILGQRDIERFRK
ncbi:carotenoid oxygenase family protein [Aspergillus homomorphus CBS 101889]|uniref:9-cis-epoxycarotenoid dioxygenase n=1 Tax=Aspergillus homomorphus (strain CBS 101889) TaxID=1450537 RepID=A0A395HWW8_ASPHC|nr:9-cis-epoxycarotenoid dioxygenase [Aspergillus homomorphus CBS 101889]RAL11925.1 9-cis-epoxycarotenoid dioxygenase [Aspergillus homomorphus CBS 101889]